MGKGKESFFLLYGLRFSKLPSISIYGEVFRFLRASEGCTFMSLYIKIPQAYISFEEVSSPDCLSNTAQQAVTTAFCCIRTNLKSDANFLMLPFHSLTFAIYMQMLLPSLTSLVSQAVFLTWLGQWQGWASVKSWSTLECPNVLGS